MSILSVIVPIYGVENYIERCVDSLFNQTLKGIEFIFIDDCSPDRSMELLQSKINEYHQRIEDMSWIVLVERMPTNSGLPVVRQRGLQLATGDYICHCDSDDWVDYDMYKILYEKAINENADIVVCDYAVSDGEKTIRILSGCKTLNKEVFIRDLLMQKNSWSVCNKLVKRKTCYKDNVEYPTGAMGEDMALTIQLLMNGGKMSYVPKALYYYYFNEGSITHVSSIEKRFLNFFQNKENTDIVIRFFERENLQSKFKKEILALKWRAKTGLWNMPYDKGRRRLWIDTYKEINNKVLFCDVISIKGKIKYLLAYLGLYPVKRK